MRAGSWRFATSLLDQASYQHLLELMLSPTTVVEARATYGRADGQGTFVTVWGRHCTVSHVFSQFDARGTPGREAGWTLYFALAAEEMGREAGTAGAFVMPAARSYAVTPPASVAGSVVQAVAAGAPGSPEHKALRWETYQEINGNNPKAYSYDRWSKQYDTNMRNVKVGLSVEHEYQEAMGGVSTILKTPFTKRQVDIFIDSQDYCGQLKTGPICLTQQAKIDLEKDQWLVNQGNIVEYILEKGASKPLIKAAEEAGVIVKIGRQIS